MKQTGFTLLELVVTLIIIGVLAVAALPKFVSRSVFDSRGFYDQTLSSLRYAQKAAIAQRRNVCVAFGASSVTLTIANSAGSSATCNAGLGGPNGASPYTITAPSGINFTNTSNSPATPANFMFHGSGQASSGQTVRVSGMSENITVEQGTGYVHP